MKISATVAAAALALGLLVASPAHADDVLTPTSPECVTPDPGDGMTAQVCLNLTEVHPMPPTRLHPMPCQYEVRGRRVTVLRPNVQDGRARIIVWRSGRSSFKRMEARQNPQRAVATFRLGVRRQQHQVAAWVQGNRCRST